MLLIPTLGRLGLVERERKHLQREAEQSPVHHDLWQLARVTGLGGMALAVTYLCLAHHFYRSLWVARFVLPQN